MRVCVFFAQVCTRDRGCSAHPAFPAPSDWRGREINQYLAQKHAARSRSHVPSSLRANGSRECAPDDRLSEAIHLSARRAMDCFADASQRRINNITAGGRAIARRTGTERPYFAAEKRLSNEFACTIAADPVTWPSFAGCAGASAGSESDGFSGGLAAACLVSAAFGVGCGGSVRLDSLHFRLDRGE